MIRQLLQVQHLHDTRLSSPVPCGRTMLRPDFSVSARWDHILSWADYITSTSVSGFGTHRYQLHRQRR